MSDMALELTNVYYTRYHIWQQLIKQAGELPADVIAQLAREGYEFVWGDGSDVQQEPSEKDTPGETRVSGEIGRGAYI